MTAKIRFYEREVWWCRIGKTIGTEVNGKGPELMRPVLVFKKFNDRSFLGIPLTTKHHLARFYAPINLFDGVERFVMLSQLRTFDTKRLDDKIKTISYTNYRTIKRNLMNLLNS